MAGTLEGGRRAAATNKARHGSDFYAVIGSKGGKNGHTGGFAKDRALASRAGRIGGMRSKRYRKTPLVKVVKDHNEELDRVVTHGL